MPYQSHYEMYRDNQSLWRWHYFASNGKIIAVSSESYHHKSDCEYAINLMRGSGGDPIYER
jgi:uncharacterized protein YegP (UPF0339 family)